MSQSWDAYCRYRDDVTKNNVEPVELDALPRGSVEFSRMPKYFSAPAIVYRAPDGTIIEQAPVNRGLWFVYRAFRNEADWRDYRRPMSVQMYLHA